MEQVRRADPSALGQLNLLFDDARLPELLFRYRARNWPATLDQEERQRWDEFRRDRLTDAEAGITLQSFRQTLARLMVDPLLSERDRGILSELADWPQAIGADL